MFGLFFSMWFPAIHGLGIGAPPPSFTPSLKFNDARNSMNISIVMGV